MADGDDFAESVISQYRVEERTDLWYALIGVLPALYDKIKKLYPEDMPQASPQMIIERREASRTKRKMSFSEMEPLEEGSFVKKSVHEFTYEGISERELKAVLLKTIKEGTLLKDEYAGAKLYKKFRKPKVNDFIVFDRVFSTFPTEFQTNFHAGNKSILVTHDMRDMFNRVERRFSPPYTRTAAEIIRGPGGVGKTTSMLALVHQCYNAGYLVSFLQCKELTSGDVAANLKQWAKDTLFDFASHESDKQNPWKHAPVDELDENVSCFDVLKLIAKSNLDSPYVLFAGTVLFRALTLVSEVNTLIIMDQWNTMEEKYWKIEKKYFYKETHPIGKIFTPWDMSRFGIIFMALSSSCKSDIASGSDGNSVSRRDINKWERDSTKRLIKSISDDVKESDCNEIADLCRDLPREVLRYFVQARGHRTEYRICAKEAYKNRVKQLISLDDKKSLEFAAWLYMYNDIETQPEMPEAWSVSGVTCRNFD